MRIAPIATFAILASALGIAANSARADWYDDEKEPKGIIKCEKKYDDYKCDCKFIYDKKHPRKYERTYDVDVREKDHKIVAKCHFDYLRHSKKDYIEDFDCKLVIKDHKYDYTTLYTDESVWRSNGRKASLKCKFEKDDEEYGKE